MSNDYQDWRAEMKRYFQMERATGSLEIEAVYALINKMKGGVASSSFGPFTRDMFSPQVPVSPPGVDIDRNIMRAQASFSVLWFVNKVRPKGEMDYKYTYNDIKYEDFGNFNFGAVAAAFGFLEGAALRGAGLVQVLVDSERILKKESLSGAISYGVNHGFDFLGPSPYGDQVKDQDMIKRGYRYYHWVFLNKYSSEQIKGYQDYMAESRMNEEERAIYELYKYGEGVTGDAVDKILKSLEVSGEKYKDRVAH